MSPKIRQTLYAVGLLATGTLTLLSVFRILDPNTASTISAQIAALLGVFGVGATGTAAVITNKQRHEGMFTPADPADVVVNAVQAVINAKQQADNEAQRVADAVAGLTKDVPILGPLTTEILNHIRK